MYFQLFYLPVLTVVIVHISGFVVLYVASLHWLFKFEKQPDAPSHSAL